MRSSDRRSESPSTSRTRLTLQRRSKENGSRSKFCSGSDTITRVEMGDEQVLVMGTGGRQGRHPATRLARILLGAMRECRKVGPSGESIAEPMATGWSAHAELTSGYTALSAKSRKESADNTFNTLSCITVSRIARRDVAQQFMLGKNRLDIDFFRDLHSFTSLDIAIVIFDLSSNSFDLVSALHRVIYPT